MTGNLGIVSYSDSIYSHGLPNLLKQPEFFSISNVLGFVDVFDRLHELIREIPRSQNTTVYIGNEAPIGKSAGCSIVISGFSRKDKVDGSLVVLGPTRMFYPRTIAIIDEVKGLLETA
jgi:transcriptional regulator of heat shock response